MKTLLAILAVTTLGLGIFHPNAPALAQPQGSNQAADYALSWGAAAGGYTAPGNAYARYDRYPHRRQWR